MSDERLKEAIEERRNWMEADGGRREARKKKERNFEGNEENLNGWDPQDHTPETGRAVTRVWGHFIRR